MALERALGSLSDEERRILWAHDVDGVGLAALADAGGGTPGALAVRLHRIRGRLRVSYLMGVTRIRPSSAACRPVLEALSAGDGRRQRRLQTDEHLAACPTCAQLAPLVLERRRATLVVVPLAVLMARAGRALRSHSAASSASGVVAAAVVVGALAAAGVFSTSGPGTEPGYWLAASDGGVFAVGSAPFYGSMAGRRLDAPTVGIAPTPSHRGYWLVSADGGVFSFGDARFFGSLPNRGQHPESPVVGMTAARSGDGYLLLSASGQVWAFGAATVDGSCGDIGGCVGRSVAIIADASGDGYWIVTDTGSVYAFGDARYLGGDRPGASPVVAAASVGGGKGYVLAHADGSLTAFGPSGARKVEAAPGTLTTSVVALVPSGSGVATVTASGTVEGLGRSTAPRPATPRTLNAPIVAATPA